MKVKKVSDLTLAAFLKTVGHSLLGVEGNGYKAFFLFEDTPQLEADTLKYFNSQATVDPLRFGEMIRNFKGLAIATRHS